MLKFSNRPIFFALCFVALAFSSPASLQADFSGMRLIPGGPFRPLYSNPELPESKTISRFWLDELAVTNRQFLEFVKANPKWRRSRVSSLFADENYLKHWGGDLELGPRNELLADLPVVNVSWYAARAYARWRGKRLPSQEEWEYAALASENSFDGRNEEGHYQRILDWYSRPNQDFSTWQSGAYRNAYGICDMHGLVWEWVEDFNTNLSTGESRADSSLDRKFFCGSASLGASNFKDYAAFMRYGYRSSLEAAYTSQNLGFRCASDVNPQATDQ